MQTFSMLKQAMHYPNYEKWWKREKKNIQCREMQQAYTRCPVTACRHTKR